MVPVEKLKSLKIFRDISSDGLNTLAKAMMEENYKKGDHILKEGETTGSLFLISKGLVAVEKRTDKEEGHSKTVARLEAEEFFGEMAFLENQAHSASVVALDDTEIFRMPRKALDDVFEKEPRSALEQVLTLLGGVSSRLRRTTNELVAIFEIAKAVGATSSLRELMDQVLDQLAFEMGKTVSISFYRWNVFNDEYNFFGSEGKPHEVPATIDVRAPVLEAILDLGAPLITFGQTRHNVLPLSFKSGQLYLSRVDAGQQREGLFLYYTENSPFFDSGHRQLIDSVSSVLAPVLESVRHREEAEARQRWEQGRQRGVSL